MAAITERQFYEALTALGIQLEKKINERADQLAEQLSDHVEKFDNHVTADQVMANDIRDIKTERKLRGGLLSFLISLPGGLLGLYALLKLWKP